MRLRRSAVQASMQDFNQHRSLTWHLICHHPPASWRKASMGSMEAARRAGYNADSDRDRSQNGQRHVPVCQVGNRPAKKSGMGSRSTSAHRPKAISKPSAAADSATIRASRKNCRRMLSAGAPMALRTPISRVRSEPPPA